MLALLRVHGRVFDVFGESLARARRVVPVASRGQDTPTPSRVRPVRDGQQRAGIAGRSFSGYDAGSMRWLPVLFACLAAVLVAWSHDGEMPAPVGDPVRADPPPGPATSATSGEAESERTAPDAPAPVAGASQARIPGDPPPTSRATGGLRVRGRVFALDATPVAGARVIGLPELAGRVAAPAVVPDGWPRTSSDDAGDFELACREARPLDIVVSAPGHAPAVVRSVVPADPGADLIITLGAAASVAGRLVGPPGARVWATEIELWIECAGIVQPERYLGPGSTCPGGQLVATAQTGRAGEFSFVDLPAGDAVVSLAARLGNARAAVRLVPGVEHRVDLALAPPGRVRGSAQPSSLVFLYGGQFTRSISAREDGTFVLDGIPPGRYLITSMQPPIAEHMHAVVREFETSGRSTLAREIIVDADATLTVELEPPSAAIGGLTGDAWLAGEPAAGATVELEPADGSGTHVQRTAVGPNGGFGFPVVPGGDYDVKLWPAGAREPAARQSCRVVNGTVGHVTLIARPATVRRPR